MGGRGGGGKVGHVLGGGGGCGRGCVGDRGLVWRSDGNDVVGWVGRTDERKGGGRGWSGGWVLGRGNTRQSLRRDLRGRGWGERASGCVGRAIVWREGRAAGCADAEGGRVSRRRGQTADPAIEFARWGTVVGGG